MSTLAYGFLTTRQAAPPPAQPKPPSAIDTYVSTVAALVPAEVLVLHATILSFTTVKTIDGATVISQNTTLSWSFLGLILLSIVLYIFPRFKNWEYKDYLRVLIPPLAFVSWTMLQRTTAFDAVFPNFNEAPRTVIALFLVVLLGLASTLLSYKTPKQNA